MSKVKQLQVDVNRYFYLKNLLNPNNDSFIVMTGSPEWNEFNALSIKLAGYFKYVSQSN